MRSCAAPDYERALELYKGDLLTEDPYADWCAAKRDQLRAVREQLLMRLARACTLQDQHARAMKMFETLVEAVPSNEEAHRELMTLYTLTGRRSDALRQFRRCCDALRPIWAQSPTKRRCSSIDRSSPATLAGLPRHQGAGAAGPAIDRIAVLPFDNETDDADLEYLSTGIAESLIKNLSQLQQCPRAGLQHGLPVQRTGTESADAGPRARRESGGHRPHQPRAGDTDHRRGAGGHVRQFAVVGRAISLLAYRCPRHPGRDLTGNLRDAQGADDARRAAADCEAIYDRSGGVSAVP